MPLVVYTSRCWRAAGNLLLGSAGHRLGGPVELSLQNSSGRFGWRRLVPPHPGPLPQGEGTPHPSSLLSRTSLPLVPCAPRFNAEAPARASAFDSPLSGERFSLSPRERAG